MQFSESKPAQHVCSHKRSIRWIIPLAVLLFVGLANIISSPAYAAPIATKNQPTYVDKKLGFSLQFPNGWIATPQPGRANNENASVIFTNPKLSGEILQVGVMRSPTAAADFALRGTPTLHIGNYPAFKADTHAGQQFTFPCLVRIMLAHNDTVLATWCAKDASIHAKQFEAILATYRDHSTISNTPNTVNQPNLIAQNAPVNPVLSCGQVISSGENSWGTLPSSSQAPNFGQQIVNPTDATWTSSFGEGVAVCNDDGWEGSYLFQCVELANRFISEEWGLRGFSVDAYVYYDYYQQGTSYPGQARTLFGNQVQLIDDASQGNNSAPPVPGDLLIFQDVNDGAHWTSGELYNTPDYPGGYDPGHVVVVTSVTSNTVNVVQQNWPNGEKHSFSLQHLSNGYHVVDNSDWTSGLGRYVRITRGWIHFSANGGSSGGGSISTQGGPVVARTSTHMDTFWAGTNGAIESTYWDASSGWATPFSIAPSGSAQANAPVTAVASDSNHLNVFWTAPNGAIDSTNWDSTSNTWATAFSVAPAGSVQPGSSISAISRASTHIDLFWTGTNGAIDSTYWDSATGWWGTVAAEAPAGSAPAGAPVSVISRNTNHMDLFWSGTDGAIDSIYWDASDNPQWSGTVAAEAPAGSAQAGSLVSVVARNPTHMDLFWAGVNGAIDSTYWDAADNPQWATAFSIAPGGSTPEGNPVISVNISSNQMDVFWATSSGALQYVWWNSNPGTWSSTTTLAGTGAVLPLGVVSRDSNHIDVFWSGANGAIESADWNTSASWNTVVNIMSADSTQAGALVASVARDSNHMDTFWATSTGAIEDTTWNSTSNVWSPATGVAPAGSVQAGVPVNAVAIDSNDMDVFWATPNGAVESASWNASTGWASVVSIAPSGSAQAGEAVNSTMRDSADLNAFWVAPSGAIESAAWNASTGWAVAVNATSAGSAPAGAPINGVARSSTHIDLFWTGANGAIDSTWWDASSGWWNSVGAETPAGSAQAGAPVSVVARTSTHMDLFWTGTNGAIDSTYWDSSTGWWGTVAAEAPAGSAQSGTLVSVVDRTSTHMDLFWTGTDGAIDSIYWDSATGWSGIVAAEAPAGSAQAGSPVSVVDINSNHLDVFWATPNGALDFTWWDANPDWSPVINVAS